ncbi:hypothetical protein QPB21_004025 [Vibrio alginolyticus]|uniref:hypothetical protein n=1 Tax=unclassified Vibrio TaxID=2614977 RepID=UPI00280848AE|nr:MULTISPECIES: hypothetical protein [unclassified Vibrio]EGR0171677.1 hypothetical protein [Vibrio alginolyticus]EII5415915.1 hypothetical protein [Vibrio alginolyticus]EIO9265683.1 hypothetical protein [Vibrio alginolyticus]EJL6727491.1 hypothetical protein [Vibrio alginolyticus]EJL6857439.1 hypothetical protein [Vibrio alginolyticus]
MRLLLILIFSFSSYTYANEKSILGSWKCIKDGPAAATIDKTIYSQESFQSDIFTLLLKVPGGEVLRYKTAVKGQWKLLDNTVHHQIQEIQITALNELASSYVKVLRKKADNITGYSSKIHSVSPRFMSFWVSSQSLSYCFKI